VPWHEPEHLVYRTAGCFSLLASNNLAGLADVPSSNCCPTIVRVGPAIGADQATCGSSYCPNKTAPAGSLVGCDSHAAWPGVRESSAIDEKIVNILTGTLEKNWKFALAFSKDSAGRPTLVVKSDSPWMTDLAFACCDACPAGTASQLQEVDLSDNQISGPPPLSFEKLRASVLQLKLTNNSLAGDYTALAVVQRTFLRADLQFFGLQMEPQRQCIIGTYAQAHAGVLDDVPTCTPIPVRPERARFATCITHIHPYSATTYFWRCAADSGSAAAGVE
jgi:hypothetical protein